MSPNEAVMHEQICHYNLIAEDGVHVSYTPRDGVYVFGGLTHGSSSNSHKLGHGMFNYNIDDLCRLLSYMLPADGVSHHQQYLGVRQQAVDVIRSQMGWLR